MWVGVAWVKVVIEVVLIGGLVTVGGRGGSVIRSNEVVSGGCIVFVMGCGLIWLGFDGYEDPIDC